MTKEQKRLLKKIQTKKPGIKYEVYGKRRIKGKDKHYVSRKKFDTVYDASGFGWKRKDIHSWSIRKVKK